MIFTRTVISRNFEKHGEAITLPSVIELVPIRVWGFCMVSIVLFALGFTGVGDFTLDKETHLWFQRTGALVTIFGLLMDISLSSVLNKVKDVWQSSKSFTHANRKNNIDYKKVLKQKIDLLERISHGLPLLFISVGTIVWGYGDLIYLLLEQ